MHFHVQCIIIFLFDYILQVHYRFCANFLSSGKDQPSTRTPVTEVSEDIITEVTKVIYLNNEVQETILYRRHG